jgi:hypothetical protein
MALTTLAEAKIQLNIPSGVTSEDTLITRLIGVAGDWLESYTDRLLESGAREDIQDGNRSNIFLLKQWPVTAITEVRIDAESVFTDPNTLIPATEYRIHDETELIFLNRIVGGGFQNVRIQYTAGHSTIPGHIEQAALHLVEWLYRFRSREDIGLLETEKGDEKVKMSGNVPTIVKTLVEREIRVDFPGAERPTMNR